MIQSRISRLLACNSGASAGAYALLASLIGTVIVASVSSAGGTVSQSFQLIAAEMGDAPKPPTGKDNPGMGKPTPGAE